MIISASMKPTRFELAVIVLLAGIIAYQLFIPPLIGLADNGDFARVTQKVGLAHVSDDYSHNFFSFFDSRYRIVQPAEPVVEFKSSTWILAGLARWLSIKVGHGQIFDIRILGSLYALLLLFGVWLILVSARPLKTGLRVPLAALLIVIVTDGNYVAYFNSLYSEPTALTFLVIASGSSLVLITRHSDSALFLFLYFVSTVFIVTAKPQYVSLTPGFVAFGIYLSTYLRVKSRYWLSTGLALILSCAAIWYYRQTAHLLRVACAYIAVFSDMLPNSNTRAQDLADLGLDPKYEVYTGTDPYHGPLYEDHEFREEFLARGNPNTVVWFYLMRPNRLNGLFSRSAKRAFSNPKYLGAYEVSSQKPASTNPPALWSYIRRRICPPSFIFLCLFFASALPAAIFLARSSATVTRGLCSLYLLFVFIAVAQFLVSVLVGGGEADLEKHLLIFNLAFDACLILIVLGGAHLIDTFGRPLLRSQKKPRC